VVERVLACLLARGHLLLEDLPGLGKTTLAKAVAGAVGGRFARVQCTPDLLPGDITGFSVFNQKTREFDFQPGPVFSDVLLADEINRTTPRTQSALLEAMAERQATVDNVRHPLSPTFFVIATQNPVEHHGTYPLPEAQLDRFAMKLSVGYPDRGDELDLLAAAIGPFADGSGEGRVLADGELAGLQDRVARVAVEPAVRGYLVDLGRATRAHPKVTLGLSPRGLLIWQRVAQAWAYLKDRPFATPDDVQEVAGPVLGVRLGLAPDVAAGVIDQLLETVPVPA
jgi:MoxR-like ATPase